MDEFMDEFFMDEFFMDEFMNELHSGGKIGFRVQELQAKGCRRRDAAPFTGMTC